MDFNVITGFPQLYLNFDVNHWQDGCHSWLTLANMQKDVAVKLTETKTKKKSGFMDVHDACKCDKYLIYFHDILKKSLTKFKKSYTVFITYLY